MIEQPHSKCCLKKVTLVKQENQPSIISWMIDAVKGNPVTGWNVVHWNKAMPDIALCFGYETETKAIQAYNTVTKMTSTLAACLRDQVHVKDSYVWML